jgi:bifunctional non-homologous end joining protein LigD
VAGRPSLSRAALAAFGDPLPFRSPTPPNLPGYIPIEASVPCAEPFDDHDWLFSVDWDGARALLFLDPGGAVRIQGEMPGDLARRFPDVSAPAAVRGGRGAVLDGVIAVLDREGRPDLAGFGRRLATGPAAAAELPAVYLCSDVLHLDGRSTLGWPLDRRLDALAELIGPSDVIQAPDHVRGRGEALAAAAAGRGLAALLARRASAPYRPGVASPDRLRIALSNQTTCVVAGIVARRRGGTRLILGEHAAGRLTFAGHVDGPRDRLVEVWLAQQASDLTVSAAPLDGVQPVNATWLRPALTATVRHHGRSPGGALLRPTLLAVRDDVDPGWCVQRPAVAGPLELHAGTRFSPTLLMPLPLGDAVALPQASR